MITSTMLSDSQPHLNADQLEQSIAEKRLGLAGLATDEQRSRHSRALDSMAAYAVMLREAATASRHGAPRSAEPRIAYTFKIEFDDGRWGIEEKELEQPPCVGDVVSFDDGSPWRVRSSQLVQPRPSGKPARAFFVCAQAA
jgi:hypothetical protein